MKTSAIYSSRLGSAGPAWLARLAWRAAPAALLAGAMALLLHVATPARHGRVSAAAPVTLGSVAGSVLRASFRPAPLSAPILAPIFAPTPALFQRPDGRALRAPQPYA